MIFLRRTYSGAWMLIAALACVVVLRTALLRVERIERISEIGVEALVADAHSPTGYADGMRKLIVPERNPPSYQWIMQVQRMLAHGEWRLRHADYDNAPLGRQVHTSSPYRWWLTVLATGRMIIFSESAGVAVERAAVFAGPLWHVVIILITAIFAARRFGGFTAALVAVGLMGVYPLGGAFVAGHPDDFGFSCGLALWSVLLLLPWENHGAVARDRSDALAVRRRARTFFVGGLVGGIGLWINVRVQVPVVIGIAGGGLAAAWLTRGRISEPVASGWGGVWRAWSCGGAAMSLLAYLLEYFPSHLDVQSLRLEVNHPLYAVAWLAAGELLQRAVDAMRGSRFAPDRRSQALVGAAIVGIASVPASILFHATRGFLVRDPSDLKLSPLADGAGAENIWAWLSRDGVGLPFAAAVLPLLLLIPAGWMLWRRRFAEPVAVENVCVALVPALVLLGMSVSRLRTWGALEAVLIALLVASVARPTAGAVTRARRWAWVAGVGLAVLPGAALIQPRSFERSTEAVTESEAQSLVERDIAHWLVRRAGAKRVVFLAPPAFASSLIYYGSLRGLATPYWENFDGFASAVRIAGATSLAQAESLTRRRELEYIVLPSWDLDLEAYARLGSESAEPSLIERLNRWLPPLWVRPIAYKIPVIEGLARQSIAIFAVTDMQEDSLALARLAEYFADMSRLDFALRVAETLAQKYPTSVNGLVARAQVAAAINDPGAFGEVLAALVPALGRGEDADLPWDQRVNLAVVLAQGKRPDLARTHLQRCLEEMDEAQLRMISTGSLIRALSLLRRLELGFPEGELRVLVRKLLPAEMHDKLL